MGEINKNIIHFKTKFRVANLSRKTDIKKNITVYFISRVNLNI
jgi:hypothetical protein